ncbi:putative quinol monooxygenase [Arcobacter sp. F2176]|uniref:putative quinol monooxygenase n=1 Tax=Arcobacter sp. F2176 TaxID=2044511 RepID=UPI00100B6F8B|nr:antibiotic biosynthesis monooxygenase [Arcobacter sp. F2176]RXJ82540.1 antibiotic biosynthesis monooxygenase [Arcobacter sp. F2176]
MIIAIVKAKIKNNKHDELRKIANILQYEYAVKEEGCEQYESFIDGDTFITIERWSSQELLDLHLEAQHVKVYVPKLRECVVDETFDVQFIKSDDVSFVKI